MIFLRANSRSSARFGGLFAVLMCCSFLTLAQRRFAALDIAFRAAAVAIELLLSYEVGYIRVI